MQSPITFRYFIVWHMMDIENRSSVERNVLEEKDGVTFNQKYKNIIPNGKGSMSFSKEYIEKVYHPRVYKDGPIKKEKFFIFKNKQYGEEITIVGESFNNKPDWFKTLRFA